MKTFEDYAELADAASKRFTPYTAEHCQSQALVYAILALAAALKEKK